MYMRIGAFLVGVLVFLAGAAITYGLAFALAMSGYLEDIPLLCVLIGAIVVAAKGIHLMCQSILGDKK